MTKRPQRLCAEPHRIVLSRGNDRRTITIRPWTMRACIGLAGLLAVWLVGATILVLFDQEISAARMHHHIEKQRAYEDRIASLRRQIDEINARRFLEQVTVESEIKAVRQRQAALEQRHSVIAGVVNEVRSEGIAVNLDEASTVTGSAGPVFDETQLSSAGALPMLGVKPRPAGGGTKGRDRLSDSSDPLGGIRDSLDGIAHRQQAVLNAVEASLEDTVAQLAAVPAAIGAPAPDIEGIGGPFVALRAADEAIEAESQLARIETSVQKLEALRAHLHHLPVRVPLIGPVRTSSGYGARRDPFLKRRAMHTGLDFRAGQGTPVLAAAAGRVVRAGRLGGYGKLVEIDHGNGYSTRYAHLSSILVKRGQSVEPGERIGEVGSTGRSTGPHLHYETRINGRPANPQPFVDAADLLPVGY